MPPAPALPLPRHHPRWRQLALLALLVLLVHSLLLDGLSSSLRLWDRSANANAQAGTLRFVTRTIAIPPPAPPVAVQPAAPALATPRARKPALAPAPSEPTVAIAAGPAGGQAPDAGSAPATAETAPAGAYPLAQGPDGAAAGPGAAAVPPAPAASAPASAPANATASAAPPDGTAPVAETLLPPPPVRMLYDGRGEERGFIKYAASAELLWQPAGDAYNARLEISTWGIRVRTWTSKGALGADGLLPTRFGDRPRGAELATHFQRDKGIISFSANNPDVPLQAGAQDKLSALLQLSALVAGAPERYGTGTGIRFQAADAHNAESWLFQVGALEPLDLPGGQRLGLKFSKEPTKEFDQRIEVWLAPEVHYLPVRLRITEANGAFADLLWRESPKPD